MNPQRLSLRGVHHKLMMVEAGDTLLMGDDIVCSIWKHIAELKARLLELRPIVNIKDFSTIVHAMCVDVEMLEDGDHVDLAGGLLTISKREKRKGQKYVYKVQHFADDTDAHTALLRMSEQVFEDGILPEDIQYMDNDITLLIEKLQEFHAQ